jgi:hypothetical protein
MGLSTTINPVLQEYKVPKHKSIVQTYDRVSVMRGKLNGVALIKEEFWFPPFMHCYAH